jgi:hypothetical protein
MRTQPTDAQRLAQIKQNRAEIETVDWTLVEDGEGGFLEAVEGFGVHVTLLRFDPAATPAEKMFIADAADTIDFLLKLVDRAIEKMRPPESQTPPAGPIQDDRKNYAAEAAMKCDEAAFKVFLGECYQLEKPMTNERTAQRLRSLLGISSRAELNDNDEAAARWKKLRGEYADWLKRERVW